MVAGKSLLESVGVWWYVFFFFKQKTAYEMRISDWSSDVCSSDLAGTARRSSGETCANSARRRRGGARQASGARQAADRKSVVQGTSVSVRVDLGGRRILKNKKKRKIISHHYRTHTKCLYTTHHQILALQLFVGINILIISF